MMVATEAIVLDSDAAGETDALVTLYTKEFGKIRGRAAGMKKESSRLRAQLEPLSHVRVFLVFGRAGVTIARSELITPLPFLRRELDRVAAGCGILQKVDRYCLQGEKDESLWNLLAESLYRLDKENGIPETAEFLRTFESEFLRRLGYGQGEGIRILGE
jgi:DNA repair protein RecO (recombination protein O)